MEGELDPLPGTSKKSSTGLQSGPVSLDEGELNPLPRTSERSSTGQALLPQGGKEGVITLV
jgi:hypothetical protein